MAPTRSTTQQTPFQILGVTACDDHATIRAAWKRLVKLCHPDRCPADAARLNRKLAELNAAYDKLKNHVPVRARPRAADFAAEQAAEQAAIRAKSAQDARASARAVAAQRAKAEVRAKADAQARAEALARAEAARRAKASTTARAKPLSASETATLHTATRAFADARTAFDGPRPAAVIRAA
ncbi:J domain-containing protein [Sagittula salina]|uniref:J domain-containing protein n=1 Tax=Sagittula salina TaxID=2820268 RepID=A0A940S1X4_9RHOB|nr:J domain-containing protein [Sagittula salina]MBP0481010.1 J domain-containing protein [Sagittula salina]